MSRVIFLVLSIFLFAAGCSGGKNPAPADASSARAFASPDQAADAFVAAVKKSDREELRSIFGPGSVGLLDSGDAVADKNAFEKFSEELAKKHSVEAEKDGQYVLLIGDKEWPFPVPIVSDGKQWSFDTAAGKEEILDRRIGENELKTIRLVRSYVEAQKEYVKKDRDGDGVKEFAQKAFSSPGKKDGLYWESKDGKEESPFGPHAAEAAREGYRKTGNDPVPFHGYFFKFLTAQGPDADGGKKNYLDGRGNMTKGFALLAYPARWGSSGIMSFIVNQKGVVYEKDLGLQTLAGAEAMKSFNPDDSWDPVADEREDAVDDDE